MHRLAGFFKVDFLKKLNSPDDMSCEESTEEASGSMSLTLEE